MRFIQAIVLFTAASAWAAAPNDLDKYRSTPLSFSGSYTNLILAAGTVALLALAIFAYLYLQEWRTNRIFREYRLKQPENLVPTAPAVPRRPLIQTPRLKRTQTIPAAANAPKSIPGAARLAGESSASRTSQHTFLPQPLACGVINVRAGEVPQEIYVDHEFVGMAPARLTLVRGTHLLELRHSGQLDLLRTLNVLPGAEVTLQAESRSTIISIKHPATHPLSATSSSRLPRTFPDA